MTTSLGPSSFQRETPVAPTVASVSQPRSTLPASIDSLESLPPPAGASSSSSSPFAFIWDCIQSIIDCIKKFCGSLFGSSSSTAEVSAQAPLVIPIEDRLTPLEHLIECAQSTIRYHLTCYQSENREQNTQAAVVLKWNGQIIDVYLGQGNLLETNRPHFEAEAAVRAEQAVRALSQRESVENGSLSIETLIIEQPSPTERRVCLRGNSFGMPARNQQVHPRIQGEFTLAQSRGIIRSVCESAGGLNEVCNQLIMTYFGC